MVADAEDCRHMRLALALAERGRGQTSPNPMVGAVLVGPDGAVVGLGYHRRAGEPHAEIVALQMAGPRARGATLYCTLEPCAHVGRTGPCCVAVAEAGIARVVAATPDPNPIVAGRGLASLSSRGISVEVGALREEAARQNVAFFTAMRRNRPWVVLKVATSVDGRVAAAPDCRTAITSSGAIRAVHRFRAEVDAIGIGSGTALADDPELTARGVYRERPLTRVVFDTRLRLTPRARMFATRQAGPIVVVTTAEQRARQPDRARALEDAGAEVVTTAPHDLVGALRLLGSRELRSIVLEGGPTLHGAAWRAGVVDRVQVYVAPSALGPGGLPWEMPGDFSLAALEQVRVEPVGPDVLVEGDVHRVD